MMQYCNYYDYVTGVSRVRVHRWRSDAKELPVPWVDAVRPDHTQVQLVVLRWLQVVQEVVWQQHSHIEELSADEGTDVLLVVLGGTVHGRFCGRGHRSRVTTFVGRDGQVRPPYYFVAIWWRPEHVSFKHHHIHRSPRQRVIQKVNGYSIPTTPSSFPRTWTEGQIFILSARVFVHEVSQIFNNFFVLFII